MTPPSATQPLIKIIGLGIKIPGHITLEAREAMAMCEEIYSIVQEAPEIWLPAAKAGKSPVRVINVMNLYTEGALRQDNYNRAVGAILQAAEKSGPVGYVTYGNPMSYDSVAQELVREARERKLGVTVIPGISSIDTLLCDLGRDMAPGIQIYEASWLFGARITLRTDVDAILLQLGAFGSFRARYLTVPSVRDLTDLQQHLLEVYPCDHQIFVVRSSDQFGGKALVSRLSLAELSKSHALDIRNTSMLIPAVRNLELSQSMVERMTQQ